MPQPAGDNRPFSDDTMRAARTGAQPRRLPVAQGRWDSVFRRCRLAGTGLFDALSERWRNWRMTTCCNKTTNPCSGVRIGSA